MAWTEERIDKLKGLWLLGYSATDIAERLGQGVSRNAVIGKAHRLGLGGDTLTSTRLLLGIEDLGLSTRTIRLIRRDNIFHVGDLAQKTESELLQMPDFGRQSLNEVKLALESIGLRLGLYLSDWPPAYFENSSLEWEAARRVKDLRQASGGATFQPVGDHFTMATDGSEDDLAAALRPMNQQMQSAILQKAKSFADLAARLDNQVGWGGITRTMANIVTLLDRQSAVIPEVLGLLYPAAIELGSFIEFDHQLVEGFASYASPLDPEIRRPLSDLVRSLAPWLRAFPSIRQADDDASRFLIKAAELEPTIEVVSAAGKHDLLADRDLEVFRQLHEAAQRGTYQGEKGGGLAKRSAANFVVGVVAFAGTFFSGAVASDYATTSPLVHKVGQFLVHTEISVEALTSDLPQDLRYSISEFVSDLHKRLPFLPPPVDIVKPTERPPRQRKRTYDQEI